ncbi:autotransporter outer membrane beta-barrel domain-containing protein [Bradyrhizobium sp. USDA 10063]
MAKHFYARSSGDPEGAMHRYESSNVGKATEWTVTIAALVAQFGWWVSPAAAQVVCPSPAVVTNSSCTVPPGTIITVTPANAIGLNASGAAGQITANGITENLAAAATTGALAQSGSTIFFNGSMLQSTATVAANANNQTGLRATGGSTINAVDATIRLSPMNAAGTAFLASTNMVGARADDGGKLFFNNTSITTQATTGAAVGANHGLVATGAGSEISFTGGSVSTLVSRGSFGALAQGGGTIKLDGTQVTTTGAQIVATSTGSHGLVATGAGSKINATGVTVSSSGMFANAVRAENGGSVSLISSSISTSGVGSDSFPSAAARAVAGGTLQISGAGSSITTTGVRGHGVSVEGAGSQGLVSGTAITVGGDRAIGILGNGAGSMLQITDSNVGSNGLLGYGIRAQSASVVSVTGGSVTTAGDRAVGLSSTLGSSLTATNVAVMTTGTASQIPMGAFALSAGALNLNGGSVETVAGFGLAARDPGATLISSGTTVLTHGRIGHGAAADDGGSIMLTGNAIKTENELGLGLFAVVEQVGPEFAASVTANRVSVETLGLNAYGAMAQQNFLAAPALVTVNDSSIVTHGEGAVGLRAISAGTVIANRSAVLTEGIGAHGMLARSNPSSVILDTTSVLSTGANAHGGVAENGGLISGINSTVTATGANGSALLAVGEGGTLSTATFINSTLSNVSGPTIGVAGAANISLTNTIVGGSGQWLKVGTTEDFPPLALPETPLTGIQDPEAGAPAAPPLAPALGPVAQAAPGVANVVLTHSTVTGSAFTAPGSVSNVTLQDNSTWIMTGSSNVTNLVNDPSLIQFTPPSGDPLALASYKTLTTVNYLGIGGVIGLNTYLGNDASPSDRLVINGGNASGNSPLSIRNTVGAGALTVANGILVVDTLNGGTTAPGTFSLAGPVVAGPYEYTLHRSSVDASNPQAWYLRSTLDCTLDPSNPACAPGPTPEPPNFRRETSLYAAIPSMALLYGRTLLDTLHERVGDEEDLRNRPRLNDVASGAWGRVIGQHGNHDGDPLGVFGSGPKFNYDIGAFQGGQDFLRRDGANGSRDHAGLYTAIGLLTGGVSHVNRTFAGNDRLNAYSLGGYWTHFGAPGWYVDAILQGTWYDAKGISGRLPTLTTNGWGFAGSLEAGYPIKLGGGFIVEPQAQIVYQTVSLDDGNDTAASVQFRNVESLAARIGARIARTWSLDDSSQPRSITAWIRPSLWNEFRGTPRTLFSSADGPVPFQSNIGGTWFELNAGMNAQITRATSLFANVGYQVSTNADTTTYSGKVGMRMAW